MKCHSPNTSLSPCLQVTTILVFAGIISLFFTDFTTLNYLTVQYSFTYFELHRNRTTKNIFLGQPVYFFYHYVLILGYLVPVAIVSLTFNIISDMFKFRSYILLFAYLFVVPLSIIFCIFWLIEYLLELHFNLSTELLTILFYSLLFSFCLKWLLSGSSP